MKLLFLRTAIFITLLFLLNSCGGGDAKKITDGNKNGTSPTETVSTKSSDKNLIDGATKPEGYTFSQQDFEGGGTLQMPTGADWQKDGKTFYNEKLDMTIILNSQNDDMRDVQEEYVQSFIDNNNRDAPNYKLGSRESGAIHGTRASLVSGFFNNGEEYATRDYLFFTDKQSMLLQARTIKQNEALLKQMIDYMAQSFNKK